MRRVVRHRIYTSGMLVTRKVRETSQREAPERETRVYNIRGESDEKCIFLENDQRWDETLIKIVRRVGARLN